MIRKLIMIIIFGLIMYSYSFCSSGPPIPPPKVSITEACKLASDHFYSDKVEVPEGGSIKKEDYFLISAQYTSEFDRPGLVSRDYPNDYDFETRQEEWVWKITFIHPIQNSQTVTYKVTDDRDVLVIFHTV